MSLLSPRPPEQLTMFGQPEQEQPVGIVAVCHLCGARSEPIPSHGMLRDDGWWEGVAFGLIALDSHRRTAHPEQHPTEET